MQGMWHLWNKEDGSSFPNGLGSYWWLFFTEVLPFLRVDVELFQETLVCPLGQEQYSKRFELTGLQMLSLFFPQNDMSWVGASLFTEKGLYVWENQLNVKDRYVKYVFPHRSEEYGSKVIRAWESLRQGCKASLDSSHIWVRTVCNFRLKVKVPHLLISTYPFL